MGRGRGRGGGDRDAQYTTAAAEEDAARGSSQLGQKGGERVGIRARAITEKRAGSTTRPHGHAYLGLDLGRVGQGVCPTSRGGGAGGGKRRRHCRGARGDRAKPGGEIDRLAHRAQQERRARDRVHVGTRRRVARHHRVQQLPQLGGEGLLQLWARRGRRPVDDRVDEVKVRRVVRVRVPAEDPLEANQPDRPNVRGEAVHAAVDEPFGRHVGGGAAVRRRHRVCGVELARDSEVGELNEPRRREEHVGRLEVTMHRPLLLVQVRQPLNQLKQQRSQHRLAHPRRARPLQRLVQPLERAFLVNTPT
mmetsp:Transcript_45545/g.151921  ORF Transcript_45545/g.151921 Transcript_45545/m.151921 type:complete len:306 (+) Transcript_45545:28-945(+)